MTIFVEGKIHGKGRPRFSRSGVVYTDAQTKAYEEAIAAAYKTEHGELIGGAPVKVYIEARFKIPAYETKANKFAMQRDKIRPTKKPDIDNVAKVVLDALNGVAFSDDKQVVDLYVRKVYAINEGLRIVVEEMKLEKVRKSRK
ncbi:RusA family crossover junction endodeoxyribonuclease [Ruminococcus sp.]|uniref:RusA family crossover junction endodeoxyribonuclease n=1 Tax=Ruminococcus sp. TaxID=41978 RepID=UPI0038903A1A